MNALVVETPNYVLLHCPQRIGPEILASSSGQNYIAIYGFSDKQPYDAFCKNSELALTPYPLVKGDLRNRIEAAGDTILIIAIDAAGPDEPILNGSAMQSVLEALEEKTPQVAATYLLTKENQTHACRAQDVVT